MPVDRKKATKRTPGDSGKDAKREESDNESGKKPDLTGKSEASKESFFKTKNRV